MGISEETRAKMRESARKRWNQVHGQEEIDRRAAIARTQRERWAKLTPEERMAFGRKVSNGHTKGKGK